MNIGIDINAVKEYYSSLPDDEIVRIASTDAAGITEEAQQVIRDEIRRRNLDHGLVDAIEVQNIIAQPTDIDKYCELISSLPCPVCGNSTGRLNGTARTKVTSLLIFSTRSRQMLVACPDCLDKFVSDALTHNLLLGWWGIPWGIVWTLKAINQNRKAKEQHHYDLHSDQLQEFVKLNIGQLELHKDNREALQRLISMRS